MGLFYLTPSLTYDIIKPMTLPDERTRAIVYTQRFLRELLDPKKTPKVPKHVREKAYSLLKHYPALYQMKMVVKKLPGVFGEFDEDEGCDDILEPIKKII